MKNEIPVFKSLEIIEARIAERLTVEAIADGVYFSKHHYSRLFREIVGSGVMEYVTKRKLTLAGRTLLETHKTVLDVALAFGYDSHEGFTRAFKTYMGVTPTDYRKYGLAAISQQSGKGRNTIKYSNTTDEIIRELNELVVKAKELAADMRKCQTKWLKAFWDGMAVKTDAQADAIKAVLERVANIAEYPDEINNRFDIIQTLEDCAFMFNIMAFHAAVNAVGRMGTEETDIHAPLSERIRDLAYQSAMKCKKIHTFLNELSALIFEDMRQTAAGKIQDVVAKGKAASEPIARYYPYIHNEIMRIVTMLSDMSIKQITARLLDDCAFMAKVVAFSADIDVLRSGGKDAELFAGYPAFVESLENARDFFGSLPVSMPEPSAPSAKSEWAKFLDDIAFQCGILLFYLRGEIEKITGVRMNVEGFLKEEPKAAFYDMADTLQGCVDTAKRADDPSAFQTIAQEVQSVHDAMMVEVEKMGLHGGAFRVIAGELGTMAKKVERCYKDTAANLSVET